MKTLITNISKILHIDTQGNPYRRGGDIDHFPVTEKAWLMVEDECIHSYGTEQEEPGRFHEVVDAQGGMVLPAFVDSHTHLIFAETREEEFTMRLRGMTYAEIAHAGGGILNSARALRQMSEQELYDGAAQRLRELIAMGTGAIEVKSGYGLSPESEIKMLRVATRLEQDFNLPLRATFLGAHALPEKFKDHREAYIRQLIDVAMPEIARQGLASYIDVFCEEGYFTVHEMKELLRAGREYGLKPKLHLNQFTALGAIKEALAYRAISVDHLEVLAPGESAMLGRSHTVATLLPGCSLFLEIPYAPARQLLADGAIVALASDFNPGSAPSGNMALAVSLACIKMKMTPEEALTAATLNGAAALELSDQLGSIEVGKLANLILTKPLRSYSLLPYQFGHNYIREVFIKGEPRLAV